MDIWSRLVQWKPVLRFLLEPLGRSNTLSVGIAELYNIECEPRAGRGHCMERACQQVEPIQWEAKQREREKEKLKDKSGDIIWVIPAVTEDRPTPGLQLPLLSTTWIRFLILATWHPEMINNGDHIMINNFAFPSSQLSWWDPASQLIFMLSIANDSCRHCGYSHE